MTNNQEKPATNIVVLVATRKGAWLYHSDAARKTWRADGPHFLGHIINGACSMIEMRMLIFGPFLKTPAGPGEFLFVF